MKKTDNQNIKEESKSKPDEQIDQKVDNTITEESEQTDNLSGNANNEAAIWQDKYARLSAEFDNFRKRTVKEKMELITSGGEKVLKSVIEIADDFERALKSMDTQSPDYMGVELIYKKLMETLKAHGVKQIEALDKPLDVDFHEAIAKFPVENPDKVGTVIDVVQNGYLINEKVLRFAKVVVGE